jgi:hypothetical protein
MKLRPTRRTATVAVAAAAIAMTSVGTPAIAKRPRPDPVPSYAEVVASVADMVHDNHAQRLAHNQGLKVLNVLWEDTGRWEGSALGPNISDVTIEVEAAPNERYLMPVIRHDNFTDKTGDVKLDRIFIPVGNHGGSGKLKTISLADFLRDPGKHMSLPSDGTIAGGTLLAERDSHALVSAQHAFLPVPKDGKATFWPVIFNYQSYADNPAVLTLLVTRQGTSMTIVDNERDTVADGGSWGQRLYFNKDGKKAPLIAERLKDVKRKGKTKNGEDAAALGEDANLLMIIQVPLKQKRPPQRVYDMDLGGGYGGGAEIAADEAAPPPPASKSKSKSAPSRHKGDSDVDVAVLGHGDAEGPFTELAGLAIERDPKFPVRVTIQFYQATSNGVVSASDVERMSAQIAKVYDKADYVGSLVVPAPSDQRRPTRWTGAGVQPDNAGWYHFPGLVQRYRRYGWFWAPEVTPVADAQPSTIGIK